MSPLPPQPHLRDRRRSIGRRPEGRERKLARGVEVERPLRCSWETLPAKMLMIWMISTIDQSLSVSCSVVPCVHMTEYTCLCVFVCVCMSRCVLSVCECVSVSVFVIRIWLSRFKIYSCLRDFTLKTRWDILSHLYPPTQVLVLLICPYWRLTKSSI